MVSSNTSIEVVVPVHNRKNLTLQCLRSLYLANQSGLDVHVILVDDGSTDGTVEEVRQKFPLVEVIRGDGNLWYTAGTNRGLEAALLRKPDYILAINNDQVFHHQALQRLVRCAQENSGSITGPLLLDWDHPDRVMSTGVRWDTWYGGWRHPQSLTGWDVPMETWEVEIIVGNCVLYPIEAIKQVGLMDEKALPIYGDAEYTPRMKRAGWKLRIEPRAYVWCQPNTIPPSLRSRSIKELPGALLFDNKSRYNLVTGFRASWAGAPSRWLGLAAFVIRVIRLALYGVGLGGAWPAWPDNGFFTKKVGNSPGNQDFARALASIGSLMDVSPDSLTD